MDRAEYVQDAIYIDEIGLNMGLYGPYSLASSYQPIYRIEGNILVPFALEGLVKVQLNGASVPPKVFFASIPEEDGLFVECMCRALHMRNFGHVYIEGMDLFFNMDPTANKDLGRALREIRYMAKRIGELGLDPRRLVCEIIETRAIDTGTLRGIVKELRRHGIRIAIDDYGAEHSNMERVEMLLPDIIKIDGEWFRQLVAVPASARLVATMVAGFRAKGVKVLIEGIETPDQLRAAMQAGAAHVQGYLMAGPQLAGSDFELEALDIGDLLAAKNTVLRMAL